MKNLKPLYIFLGILLTGVLPATLQAQEKEFYLRPSYWTPYDQRGLNQFETGKQPDSIAFAGLRIRFGAGFTQSFQGLEHKTASEVPMYKMVAGFNLAQANLITDVQLAEGIRLHLATYLSTRHHNETWVKGGYIQFDKLPFKGQFWDKLMDMATIRIGHMEINYGDQHFRRTDAGMAIYNPFVENYIADAFSTEIGGEIYLKKKGVFGMLGITNGTINSSINKQKPDATGDSSKSPAIYFKGGLDRQLTSKLRIRLSGSYYMNNNSQRNVLYAGDRAGSNYFGVMETAGADLKANFSSGRFSPDFTRDVKTFMLNGFVKYQGLELFGTIESAKGNAGTATDKEDRKMNQLAVEGIYRLGKKENVFIGGRYNTVAARLAGYTEDVNINRASVAAGWYLTKNVLLKGEYVNQEYRHFAATDIKNGGKFNGYVIQAVIGF